MELINLSNAEIWRLLLPPSQILFPQYTARDECIFLHRRWLFFVYSDGSTIRIHKPKNLKGLTYNEIWDQLFLADKVYDYDHEGIFDLGEIILDIGFVVPVGRNDRNHYTLEIVSNLSPNIPVYSFHLKNVNLSFAVYKGILVCTELYYAGNKQEEFLIRRIVNPNYGELASHV